MSLSQLIFSLLVKTMKWILSVTIFWELKIKQVRRMGDQFAAL